MKKLVAFTMLATIFAALIGTAQAGQTVVDCVSTVDRVPDAGTTSALMGVALAGLAIVRRFVR